MFEYKRWNEDTGTLTPDNINETILSGSGHCYGIASFVERVMKTKKGTSNNQEELIIPR